PPPLPSLLRYVDNYLLRNAHLHNHPPNPAAVCPICRYQHDQALVPSTFLPLWPCNHWVHYRCLIWHATRLSAARDKCPCCNTPLFIWEGMTALTLATRTSLEFENENLPRMQYDKDSRMWVKNSGEQYVSDCVVIEMMIRRHWNREMRRFQLSEDPSDRSPNLVALFYAVFSEIENMGRPTSAWLGRQTEVGYHLWGMLIWHKMRRFLEEECMWVVGTEGWTKFLDGGMSLQGKILGDV
ncbi:hypothetical protein K491DRAFT_565479, partial [Lophiostoma macrostomum CBS 122681]